MHEVEVALLLSPTNNNLIMRAVSEPAVIPRASDA